MWGRRFLLCSLTIVTSALAGPVATFQGLGQLDGRVFSTASAISSDGSTVVGTAFDESGSQAFRWTRAGGMKSLGDLDGQPARSFAFGVNSDGSAIVGRAEQPDNVQGFRWTAVNGMGGADRATSEFNAISADGTIAAGRFTSTQVQLAARWSVSGDWHPLDGALPDSNAFGISSDGSVIVGVNENHAFRWTESGGIQDIGPTGQVPTHSIARDVSADGSVVVGDGGDPERAHAFRWTSETGIQFLTGIGVTDVDTYAYATNGDGSVIVGEFLSQGPLIWDQPHGVRNLQTVLANQGADVHGWTQMRAFGVSSDGLAIVGDGRNPSGNTEAWIATLSSSPAAIPLPNGGMAGGFVLLLLGGRAVKSRR